MRVFSALRQTVRSLRRAPAFFAAAVITLALGIGATSAIFSVVNAVLLRPLPYRDAGQLVTLRHTMVGIGIPDAAQSMGTYYHYRHTSHTLAAIGAWHPAAANLADAGDAASDVGTAERVDAAQVSPNVFALLGVAPEAGREFVDADQRKGVNVALISDDLWRGRFGGAANIVGREARIDGDLYRIVGVMPAGFHFPSPTTTLWRPLQLDTVTPNGGGFSLGAVARLAPGQTAATAQAELNRLLAKLPESYPNVYPELPTASFLAQSKMHATVQPLRDALVGDFARALWIVTATVGVLLLAACTNVAALLLVRAHGRTQELAVRTALGASPGQLVRRYFAESAVIAGVGCVAGVAFAVAATRLLVRFGPTDLPRLSTIHVDAVTIAFTVVVAAGVALACGALPALRFRHAPLDPLLRAGGRSGMATHTQQRAQRTLIVVQVALAVVLLAGSGLLARSIARMSDVRPGFDPSGTLAFTVSLPQGQFAHSGDVARFYDDALQRLRTLPGVTAAGVTSKLPLVGGETLNEVFVEDAPVKPGTVPPVFPVPMASADYFQTMGIRLVSGRTFLEPADAGGANDVIVSRAFADRYWPDPAGRRALGKRVRMENQGQWKTIVGVVESVRDTSLRAQPIGELYTPVSIPAPGTPDSLAPNMVRVATFVVRSTADPSTLEAPARRLMHSINPGVPIYNVQPLSEVLARTTARARFVLLALVAAAAITLILGAVGLYGVIAYAVTFRRRELGVRLALGAEPKAMLMLVLRDGVQLAVIGVVAGLVLFTGLARFLKGMLFEISPGDPVTLVAVAAGILLVAAAASLVPAWRAARTDPVDVLRGE